MIVEVRVPTFKRPHLLKRALTSLVNQSFGKWHALVFDDSKGREAEKVVRELDDPRVYYAPNSRNRGQVDNLNYCFSPKAFLAGSTHACVLEDDNWYEPNWIAANLDAIQRTGTVVLARNYRLVDVAPDGKTAENHDSVMAGLYGSEPRWLSLEERVKESFFSYTIGNLAYCWKLGAAVDLSMSDEHLHVHVAETGRSICFGGECWFEPQPLAFFSRFVDKRQTPSGEAPHTERRRRLAKVSEMVFTRRLWRYWEDVCKRSIMEIIKLAQERREGVAANQRLAEAGSIAAFRRLNTRQARIAAMKSWVVAMLYAGAWRKENSSILVPEHWTQAGNATQPTQ